MTEVNVSELCLACTVNKDGIVVTVICVFLKHYMTLDKTLNWLLSSPLSSLSAGRTSHVCHQILDTDPGSPTSRHCCILPASAHIRCKTKPNLQLLEYLDQGSFCNTFTSRHKLQCRSRKRVSLYWLSGDEMNFCMLFKQLSHWPFPEKD